MSKPSVQTSPTSGAWLTALAASTPGRARSRSTAAAKNAARRLGSASAEPLHRHRHRQHAARVEARIDGRGRGEAAQHQAGADQQDERQRQLGDHEHVAQQRLAAVAGRAARAEAIADARPRRLPGRHQAEDEAGDDRDAEREGQRPALDRHVGGARQVGRRHRRDGAHAERRQGQADDAAQAREQQALDQQLTHDLEPRRAEREADGDLRLPRRGARQQHVRDVGAGDQQHEADRDEQHRQAEPRVADDALLERHHLHVAVGVRDTPLRGGAVTTSTSAWAAAGLTPGLSRAKTRRLSPSRLSRRASSGSGAHSSAFTAQNGANTKRGGITPTIV